MSYSIIIPYRDREEHLRTLLPRLTTLFEAKDYEIIVAEQVDEGKFKKNILYNTAAQYATKDLLVFHDVDYYPTDDVDYHTTKEVPMYPVRQVIFLGEDNNPLPIEEVPAGYRSFSTDVGDHSGGVFVLSRHLFDTIGGFNPFYFGWGKEDDDTRDRVRAAGYNWNRNGSGLFLAMYHKPIGNLDGDPDWINNNIVYSNFKQYTNKGSNNCSADVEEFLADANTKWLKISNLQVNEDRS